MHLIEEHYKMYMYIINDNASLHVNVYFKRSPLPVCLNCILIYSIYFSWYFQINVQQSIQTQPYPFDGYIVSTLNGVCHDEISMSTWLNMIRRQIHVTQAHTHIC